MIGNRRLVRLAAAAALILSAHGLTARADESATDAPAKEAAAKPSTAPASKPAAPADEPKAEPAKSEASAKPEAAKPDSTKTEPAKGDAAKADSPKAEPAKSDAPKAESPKAEPAKPDAPADEPAKPAAKAEEPKAEPSKPAADTKPPADPAKPSDAKADAKADEKPAESKPVEPKPADPKPEPAKPEPKASEPTKPEPKAAEPTKPESKPDATASAAASVAAAATKPATAATDAVATAAAPASKPVETVAPKPAAEDLNFFQRVWYAQGHTHPIVVHFPIGLLFAAALAAVLRPFNKRVTPSVVYFCLLVGTGGAVMSSVAGWAWAPQLKPGWDPFAGKLLANPLLLNVGLGALGAGLLALLVGRFAVKAERPRSVVYQLAAIVAVLGLAAAAAGHFFEHKADVPVIAVDDGPTSIFFVHRWGAVVVTVGCVLALALATVIVRHPNRAQWPWQAVVVVLALVMGWVGHEGGELVYADNAERIIKTIKGDEAVSFKPKEVAAPKPVLVIAPNAALDFKAQVWPVFEAKCVYCHGEEKDKGGFRMHTEAAALKGGDTGEPLYVKGDVEKSALFKHIEHPDDDHPVMPPKKEKKDITPDELALLKRWVKEGAKWQ